MTTFEAVSAHWPKPPKLKSTQRSRRSAKASSVHLPSSPTHVGSKPIKKPFSSPPPSFSATRNGSLPPDLKPEVIETFDELAPIDDAGDFDSDEEENPFDILNMTQRFPEDVPEVNPSFIQRNIEPAQEDEGHDDDPDRDQQLHEQDAQKHANESARVRATQVQRKEEDERSEYDDEEIDELFRQTVNGGFTTPTKGRCSPSVTPTSIGSGSTLASRRARRDQRMREQAGLGDLRYVSTFEGRLTVVLSWIDLPFPYHLPSHSTMPSQRLLSLIHQAINLRPIQCCETCLQETDRLTLHTHPLPNLRHTQRPIQSSSHLPKDQSRAGNLPRLSQRTDQRVVRRRPRSEGR
jgi:hypothetical protein